MAVPVNVWLWLPPDPKEFAVMFCGLVPPPPRERNDPAPDVRYAGIVTEIGGNSDAERVWLPTEPLTV